MRSLRLAPKWGMCPPIPSGAKVRRCENGASRRDIARKRRGSGHHFMRVLTGPSGERSINANHDEVRAQG